MAANEACLRKMKEFDKCVYFVNKIKCPMLNDISYAKVLICVIKYKFLTIFFVFYFNLFYLTTWSVYNDYNSHQHFIC